MDISTLKSMLAATTGGPFTLTANQLGPQTVADLFTEYLPQATLCLTGATGDQSALTVDGQLGFGGATLTTHVVFLTDDATSQVVGIVITAKLSAFSLTSPGLTFSAASAATYLSSPLLVLRAGGTDSATAAPTALVAGTPNVTLPPGAPPWQLTAVARAGNDRPEQSLAFAGSAAPKGIGVQSLSQLFGDDPGELLKLVPGLESSELSAMAVVVDPVANAVVRTRFDLDAPVNIGLAAPLPTIDTATLALVRFPNLPDAPIHAGVGARLTVCKGVDLDLNVWLPELLLEAELEGDDGDTSINLPTVAGNLGVAPAVCKAIPDVSISDLSFAVSLESPENWAFQLTLEENWPLKLGTVTFALETLQVVVQSSGDHSVDLSVTACLDVDEAHLYLALAHKEAWSFSGGTDGYQEIEFAPLLARLVTYFGLPAAEMPLTSLVLTEVDVEYSAEETVDFTCSGQLAVSTVALTTNITIHRAIADKVLSFGGDLKLVTNEKVAVEFELDVDSAADHVLLIGTLASSPPFPTLGDLLSSLDLHATIPHGLDFALTGLGALYQTRPNVDSALLLTVDTNYGDALFALLEPNAGKPTCLFAVASQLTGSLSEIPLIGSKLPPALDLSLKSAQLVISEGSLADAQVTELNALFSALETQLNQPWKLDAKAGAAPAELDLALQLGDTPSTLQLPIGGASRAAIATAATAPAPARAGQWLSVQKTLGPLFVRQVGFDYEGGDLEVLFDADLAFGPLAISLSGLSLSTPLTGFHPIFGLQGAGVSMQTDVVNVDGAFRSMTPNGLSDPNWEYGGDVVIATPAFTISGVAAYGEFEGHPSFFAFVMLSAELGGPPFFYVTGLACGFGFNRALAIPLLDKLPDFPLIQAATAGGGSGRNPFSGKTDPSDALGVLEHYLPEALGESWFAVGVRFTSFDLIDSFALLTVAVGTDVEVALLGLSKVTVPTGAADPIGYAELAIEVSFSEQEGKLAVAAELTPASYLLSQACHLTGGFAFYSWLKDNADGASAGDFVVTLGGYNPSFNKPAPYPTVPAVGANWRVTENLAVKGGVYFALTPSSVMAGGILEATWESGNLKAWFDADADFILSWRPFHYAASVGVNFGASYLLDLGFCSHTFTVSLGVNVSFSGPPFGGQAEVDLYVVSFTISFGAQPTESVNPTPWSEFSGTLGPIAAVQIAAGLICDLTASKEHDGDPDWVIAPGTFHLVTQSAVPCTASGLVSGNDVTKTIADQLPNDFGVGPVGVFDGDLTSTHTIAIHGLNENGTLDTKTDLSNRISCQAISRNMPRAPWSRALSLDLVRNPNISTVNNAPATIGGLVTGYDVVPAPQVFTTTPDPVAPGDLAGSPAPDQPFAWSPLHPPTTDSFNQHDAYADIKSINDTTLGQARAAILSALTAEGVSVTTAIDVSPIAGEPDEALSAPPLLSLLGEERAA